jgi:hypothetical protein
MLAFTLTFAAQALLTAGYVAIPVLLLAQVLGLVLDLASQG